MLRYIAMDKEFIDIIINKVRIASGYLVAWVSVLSIWFLGQILMKDLVFECPYRLDHILFLIAIACATFAILSLYLDVKAKKYMEPPVIKAVKISYVLMTLYAAYRL